MAEQAPLPHRPARPSIIAGQLTELLRTLQPGERLPGELSLSQQFGVSRNTVRDALAALQRDGAVVRQHGLGTFKAAARVPLHASLNRMLPVPELIRQSGYTPGVQNLTLATEPADEDTALALGIESGQPTRTIDMLYMAGEQPAVQIRYTLSPALLRAVPDWTDFTPQEGVLGFIVRHWPGAVSHSSTQISAVLATQETARPLNVAVGAPLLRFMTLGIGIDGTALYRNVSYQSGEFLDVHILRPV
ncbi:GntR family transcriptional regulator [Deinococcus cavernae]|uniref:GntR family transcriptional regulator n=1 Tax=Deinococcus cavernae TaxID=2320857 RepID=A0A418VJ72_9DEIO|nr:GntR family transcriptional regulator [Deinococcus cavernae]RJF76157.1 GntR family transcriptional regulator [Deinococcus cavernae]